MTEILPVTHFIEIRETCDTPPKYGIALVPYFSTEQTFTGPVLETAETAQNEALRIESVDPTIRGISKTNNR